MENQIELLSIGAIIYIVAYGYVFYRIFKSRDNDKNYWKNFT